ncbi:hypothetical protein [Peribacillus frigoritolerans]|uniref:hypothetical protein n=1 Tax=Peribacillus frigoritolerans TaxID=450367 RepID=UPI00207AB794|nr:hypothetical protein [Peribacillus frigoritolerans]USK75382.1 hypothetical protein LIT31_01870 [Peribacillus frigoritolerans]
MEQVGVSPHAHQAKTNHYYQNEQNAILSDKKDGVFLCILEKSPNLEDKILAHESVLLAGDVLKSLDRVDRTFLQLACFFENPDKEHFDLNSLYKQLDDDWLEWALELITLYFREDTYLIKKPSFSIIKENDSNYLNQSQLAHYLTEQGLKYDRAKVKNYYDRGIVPDADVISAHTKYWRKETVQAYCEKKKGS